MITRKQILLARTMLEMNQEQAAAQLGMSRANYAGIESGKINPPAAKMDEIETFFIAQGVEFTDGDGVRMRQVTIMRYQGTEQFRAFMDDLYHVASTDGGEICVFNGSPGDLVKWLGVDWYAAHAARMTDIRDKFVCKAIVGEGERHLIGGGFAEYRWFPPEKFSTKTIYTYGDRVAFLDFDGDDVRVLCIHQTDMARSMATLFNIAWDNVAIPIPGAAP